MSVNEPLHIDVAIVGGGPAGLSAAITLARARRSVVVFDHGQPRNFAAREVHCFLGLDGISPAELRRRGRQEAAKYGATFQDVEVTSARRLSRLDAAATMFAVTTSQAEYRARAVLFATGVLDQLPEIPGIRESYGKLVHHCPYCDGYEHRGQALVALGGAKVAKLGRELLAWSERVTVCSHGEPIPEEDRADLARLGVGFRETRVAKLDGEARILHFEEGGEILCEGLFFSSGQSQRSSLPEMLGCKCNDKGLVCTEGKQSTSVRGIYLAGDADGDVQFAIVAAAEGAIAATDIHSLLLTQDQAT